MRFLYCPTLLACRERGHSIQLFAAHHDHVLHLPRVFKTPILQKLVSHLSLHFLPACFSRESGRSLGELVVEGQCLLRQQEIFESRGHQQIRAWWFQTRIFKLMNKKKAKVLVIGDAAAGKSTLVQSYAKKNYQFTSDYNMTPGADIQSKLIPLLEKQLTVELFLFDLSGHEFYESVASSLGKNPDLVMVVYDCTNQDSLKNSLKWLDKVKKLNNKTSIGGVLVGAKSEHKNAKEITTEEGEACGKKLGLEFFEVSAAYNTNVEKPFLQLANKVAALGTTSFS